MVSAGGVVDSCRRDWSGRAATVSRRRAGSLSTPTLRQLSSDVMRIHRSWDDWTVEWTPPSEPNIWQQEDGRCLMGELLRQLVFEDVPHGGPGVGSIGRLEWNSRKKGCSKKN